MISLVYNETNDAEDLNERANVVESEEYEDIIKTNKKNIIIIWPAYLRGKVFWKYTENRKFKSLVENWK